MEKFHLIGIKGTGMAALALILDDLGYVVTGSDVREDFFTSAKLKKRNLKVSYFNEDNITKDKIYIASSCYGMGNVEVNLVKNNNYEFYYYHEFIEKFFKNKIGISGTHGKTTTTSILAKMFEKEKIAYLIGDGTGAANPNYEHFIFEACEYKNHFLEYQYKYLVINNIDFDHPDFFNSISDVIESFQKAANNAKYLIINKDDSNTKYIKHDNIFSFGFSNEANIKAIILKVHQNGYTIKVKILDKNYQYYLPFSGIHMIYNFLAALSIYYLNNLNLDEVQDLLLSYKRPLRRMEEIYYFDNVIIDDYAHHPKEIKACLAGIKQKYPNKEIVIIFQPHTYSRTLALAEDFKEVFQGYNLYLAKTFTSKRESTNKTLEKEVIKIFDYPKIFNEKDIKTLKKLNNKVILFLGAGNIDKYIRHLIK